MLLLLILRCLKVRSRVFFKSNNAYNKFRGNRTPTHRASRSSFTLETKVKKARKELNGINPTASKVIFQNLIKSSIRQANDAHAWIEGSPAIDGVISDNCPNVSNAGIRGYQNTYVTSWGYNSDDSSRCDNIIIDSQQTVRRHRTVFRVWQGSCEQAPCASCEACCFS
jgi:hypothetical protein